MNWINVNEKKPETAMDVLVVKKNGKVFQMHWHNNDGYAFWWWGFGQWLNQTKQITHYMPIPPPPNN